MNKKEILRELRDKYGLIDEDCVKEAITMTEEATQKECAKTAWNLWGKEHVQDFATKHINTECMQCGKYLGFRGFCSKVCHDKYFDDWIEKVTE